MAEVEPARVVVCDAGPLIHLEQLGCLDLLRDFTAVRVADAVWREVQRHQPSALRRRSVPLVHRTSAPESGPEFIRLCQLFLLDAGERAALALMAETPSAIFLTDDAAARLVAERLAYEVHGTVGVVVRAIRRGQRSKRQVLNLLNAIPRRTSLFIRRRLLESVIEQVKRN